MKLLDTKKIGQKIDRMAIQVLENNYQEEEIILIGINKNGSKFADLLEEKIKDRTKHKVTKTTVQVSDAEDGMHATIDLDLDYLNGKSIILIDDVANTGKTIFYACKPLMSISPKKIEVAVLVDRKHKSFPIKVDYVGLSLATTVNEHIDVKLTNARTRSVHLIA